MCILWDVKTHSGRNMLIPIYEALCDQRSGSTEHRSFSTLCHHPHQILGIGKLNMAESDPSSCSQLEFVSRHFKPLRREVMHMLLNHDNYSLCKMMYAYVAI